MKRLILFIQKNKILVLIITFIFLIGFFLRAQESISGNFLFLLDQGRDLIAVKNIVFDHNLTLIGPYTSLQGVFQGPLWYYLLSIPIAISNGDPRSTVILMLVISVFSVVVAAYTVYIFFGKTAAFFTFFIFAFSPEAIAAATYSWNPHPMWLLIAFYILFFLKILSGNIKYHIVLWPLIGLMFHFQTAFGVFIFFSTVIYFLVFNRNILLNKFFFIGLILFLSMLSFQIVFDMRNDFLMSKAVIGAIIGNKHGLVDEKASYSQIVTDHAKMMYYNFGTTFTRDGLFSTLPLTFLALLIIGIFFGRKLKLISSIEFRTIKSLVILIAIIILLFIFLYPFILRYWFLTGFQVFYIVLSGIILSKLWKVLVFKIVILVFCISLYLFHIPKVLQIYSNPDYGGVAKIQGKLDALDYIYKDSNSKGFNMLVFAPPVYTDNYDYLIWWYGKRKYNFSPDNKKSGTFYLLIEPDSGKPWSYKGWLETVIKSGKILKTKELPSGFIIQKRYEEP